MAKISRRTLEKQLASQVNAREYSKEEITDLLIKKWKKLVKKEKILEELKLHRYFLSKKMRRIKKAEMHKFD